MLSSTSKRSHLSPPGNPYKSSANVRQTQDQNYYPKAARILVIHSHFHSWGGSKNHRSDKLFPNVILSPRPWSPVKCYSLNSYTMEWLHLGLFVVVLCFVFCEWADDIQVTPWRDSYLKPLPPNQRTQQIICRKIQGQADLGRARPE